MKDKGLNARTLDALKDDLGSGYDMVFANGVLVHFTPEETAMVLDKIHATLKNNGIFAFSVKQGDGGEWTEEKLDAPRYFYYWQPEILKELIESHGFKCVSLTGGETSNKKRGWLYIITRKASNYARQ